MSSMNGLTHNRSGLRAYGYNVLVRIDEVPETTAGGLIRPEMVKDRDDMAQETGVIVDISPAAFAQDDFPMGTSPEIGDRVIFGRYSGLFISPEMSRDGQKHRMIPDAEIAGVFLREPAE